jgi:hypothetical protein
MHNPRIGAAGVHLVAARQSEKQKLVFVKDRPEKAPVGQVIAVTVVGIVVEDHVAGIKILAELVENIAHGKFLSQKLRGGAGGDRQGARLSIPDAGGDIMKLGH